MGIAKGAASFLFQLRTEVPLEGRVLQLGKQGLYIDAHELPGIASRFGFGVDVDDVVIDGDGEYDPATYSDVTFFEKLGFEEVLSLDHSAYEGADIIHDLNRPVPADLHGRFDLVYDGGTLEHVFNFPQCLQNVHHLLKVGGMAAFQSPSHNNLDHGFYMFSPTVFWDYFHANGYRIVKANVYEYDRDHAREDWLVYDYDPAWFKRLTVGGWGRKLVGLWFVVQKLEDSTCDVVPQQGLYTQLWQDVVEYDPYAKAAQRQASLVGRLWGRFRTVPVLGSLAVAILRQVRRFWAYHGRQERPPVIARY